MSNKLVDIIAQELGEWPDDAVYAVQELNGVIKFSSRIHDSKNVNGYWMIPYPLTGAVPKKVTLASDCMTRMISKCEWSLQREALIEHNRVAANTLERIWSQLETIPEFQEHIEECHKGQCFSKVAMLLTFVGGLVDKTRE